MAYDTLTPADRRDVAWALADIEARLPGYTLSRDYYLGEHRIYVDVRGKVNVKVREALEGLVDNLCDDVVNEPVDRMQLLGWRGVQDTPAPSPDPNTGATATPPGAPGPTPVQPQPQAPEDTIGQAAADWWEHVQGDAMQGATFTDAFRAGDGFEIVWPDPDGYPRLYHQDPDSMAVRYDPQRPGEIELAAKLWREGARWRMTVYYTGRGQGPDWLEHWVTTKDTDGTMLPRAGSFARWQSDDVDEQTGDPATASVEYHTWGMPVFHYPKGKPGAYGRSVLAPVIGLQDVLNLTMVQGVVAADAASILKRWATGVQAGPKLGDPTSTELPFKNEDSLWYSAKDTAAFGQFPTPDLTNFSEREQTLRQEIARKGCLPPYSVATDTAALPSGVALLVADGRLVKRVKDAWQDWGRTRRATAALALRMLGMQVDSTMIEAVPAPPEVRDETALLTNLALKRDLGVPIDVLLTEAGYDEEQARQWAQEKADRALEVAAQGGMMLGGRTSIPNGPDARSATAQLGVPGAPNPPAGGRTPLAQQ